MPQRTASRRMYTRLLLFSLAGFALWALGRNRPETHDRAPETVEIYGAHANDTKNTRARERSSYSKRRLATSLTFATLFFAGAALSAGAGDTVAEMMEGSDAPTAAETTTEEAPAEEAPPAPEAPAEEPAEAPSEEPAEAPAEAPPRSRRTTVPVRHPPRTAARPRQRAKSPQQAKSLPRATQALRSLPRSPRKSPLPRRRTMSLPTRSRPTKRSTRSTRTSFRPLLRKRPRRTSSSSRASRRSGCIAPCRIRCPCPSACRRSGPICSPAPPSATVRTGRRFSGISAPAITTLPRRLRGRF